MKCYNYFYVNNFILPAESAIIKLTQRRFLKKLFCYTVVKFSFSFWNLNLLILSVKFSKHCKTQSHPLIVTILKVVFTRAKFHQNIIQCWMLSILKSHNYIGNVRKNLPWKLTIIELLVPSTVHIFWSTTWKRGPRRLGIKVLLRWLVFHIKIKFFEKFLLGKTQSFKSPQIGTRM